MPQRSVAAKHEDLGTDDERLRCGCRAEPPWRAAGPILTFSPRGPATGVRQVEEVDDGVAEHVDLQITGAPRGCGRPLGDGAAGGEGLPTIPGCSIPPLVPDSAGGVGAPAEDVDAVRSP